jgi:hypothetical protein
MSADLSGGFGNPLDAVARQTPQFLGDLGVDEHQDGVHEAHRLGHRHQSSPIVALEVPGDFPAKAFPVGFQRGHRAMAFDVGLALPRSPQEQIKLLEIGADLPDARQRGDMPVAAPGGALHPALVAVHHDVGDAVIVLCARQNLRHQGNGLQELPHLGLRQRISAAINERSRVDGVLQPGVIIDPVIRCQPID